MRVRTLSGRGFASSFPACSLPGWPGASAAESAAVRPAVLTGLTSVETVAATVPADDERRYGVFIAPVSPGSMAKGGTSTLAELP